MAQLPKTSRLRTLMRVRLVRMGVWAAAEESYSAVVSGRVAGVGCERGGRILSGSAWCWPDWEELPGRDGTGMVRELRLAAAIACRDGGSIGRMRVLLCAM